MAAAAHVLLNGLAGRNVSKSCWFFGFARPACHLVEHAAVVMADTSTLLDVPEMVTRANAALNVTETLLTEAAPLLSNAQRVSEASASVLVDTKEALEKMQGYTPTTRLWNGGT